MSVLFKGGTIVNATGRYVADVFADGDKIKAIGTDLDKCIGCGQCYIVCRDAAGQAIEWDAASRRPKLIEDKCLSCMLCKFVCPVPDLISYKEMPQGWKRRETAVMDKNMEKNIKLEPFTKEGPDECVI